MQWNDFAQYGACARCGGALTRSEGGFSCSACSIEFVLQNEQLFVEKDPTQRESAPDDFLFTVKNFFKREAPWLFYIIYELVAWVIGKRAGSVVRSMKEGSRILNVGSGARRIHPSVINVDLNADQGIDVVASAYTLPFKTGSIDLVITENLLEHLAEPERAIAEFNRVLKSEGSLFVVTPFMLGFHSSPDDFYRWTIPGMKHSLKGFQVEECGVYDGPSAALAAMLREWFAILLSFNSKILYQLWTLVFMVLFIPLNVFDLIIGRYKIATQIALHYYFLAKKK